MTTRVSVTQYYTATTLDGFIADPDNSLEWLFTRERDEGGALNYRDFIAKVGALAMGSTTYEWILDHESSRWPYEQPCCRREGISSTSRSAKPGSFAVGKSSNSPRSTRRRIIGQSA